jgi:hypothetical protein
LRKLYLVYSTLIRTHCNKNQCSENDLVRHFLLFLNSNLCEMSVN